jgi:hypothetical protein
LIWKNLEFGNEIHTCKVWRRFVESNSFPICLSNLKTDASKGHRQCVQNLQRMNKESCETTCKQHSKTSIERDHYCE